MKETIEGLEKLIGTTLDSARHFNFNCELTQHCVAVSLNGSIVEMAYSCMILLKKGQFIGLPILLRSMLEGFVDLVSICKEENYLKNMQAAYYYDQRRFFKYAIEGGQENPFLADLAKDKKLPEAFESARRDLAALEEEGFPKLQIYERFKQAELENLYTSIYCLLCRETHNNLSSLEKRHLTQVDGKLSLEYFKEFKKSDIAMYVDSIGGLIVGAVKECHKLFNTEAHETIEMCDNALEELRKTI